ncbi:hypothetical protein [Streptomyces sp. NPDC048442]|uniref:hypothetical protein n=1 Tax=Streptomyces sp. NPDC048442 TaxID=3154823 RepID=UPI0034477045
MNLHPWRRGTRKTYGRTEADLAELARLLPAPDSPVLPHDRQLQLEERLMSHIEAQERPARFRSRARSRFVIAPIVLLALGGGAVAAQRLLPDTPAEATGLVRCFPTASLKGPTTHSEAMPEDGGLERDPSNAVGAAVRTCARLWEAGLINPSGSVDTSGWKQPIVIPSATPGRGKVPPLAACVLSDGQAAVFPGDERRTCPSLGLARLTDR